ncbi:60S ribosomal protein L41, putative [Perkinsus marinus ATCC 50983]|uniref:60S ribosomal protein L41 n=1 Tax=Perkinsus marinus (strain ATCC 50983 / TXsc) TaxID=423536 RepID=C5KIP6_PERM5|nr:60S ribosomal protein L41, putative [Perkinsus marinus ATCC 50983]XP_002783865.1 60S ribosomal protein L41, putative [Perkinsus marinus ATCC 50983]EER11006.1 60S ribosomal protein L41, putative [Perkinsus marinus ATCC 50983]EER15661.1 60S ribosomal protein L41, putative [Perkinsus marinus ATCC 50983]|eukprot:XP_002779211.1 60S ribosomal protein L41, putative [Perkinsus marinus ATCC 50983]
MAHKSNPYKKARAAMRWKWKKKRTRRLQRKRRKMRQRSKCCDDEDTREELLPSAN